MTLVKVCGITNLEDARHAIECGADELGFNFYKGSKRYIAPQVARQIIDRLPISSGNIGVFVDEAIENVLETAGFVGLDGIQLHGGEGPEYVSLLRERSKRFVVKAFRVSPAFEMHSVWDWVVDYHLFDAYSDSGLGGTGATFDWESFAADIALYAPETAYLAGGLTPENVAKAIRIVRPYAVDVASGVESSPGKKDPAKVAAFIDAVRKADIS